MLSDTPPTDAEVAAMTPRQLKTYEAQVRRAAARQGCALVKSRRRDPNAGDYGTYGLVDRRSRALVLGSRYHGFGYSLNDIHAALVEVE